MKKVKLAHIADVHIRNLKYHFEYREVFDQMKECLKEFKPDAIVICGDIAHTKTQISPEFVKLASEFFTMLAKISKTIIIPGNHDGNLKNSTRQDALTPIVEALNNQNIIYLKKAGEYKLNNEVVFNHLSIFDEDNWVKPSDKAKVNIALYHGAINGCKTDIGWTMDHGDHALKIFEGHDFSFLGDIHKTQFLDDEGRVAYAGSTVQQNFGEDIDKGLLLWEIESKDKWEVTHATFKNPIPFVTIEAEKPEDIKNIQKGCRLRIVGTKNLPIAEIKKIQEVAKFKFEPKSVSFVQKTGKASSSNKSKKKAQNLRDIAVQEKLIKDYLEPYDLADEQIKKVLELNTFLLRLTLNFIL